MDIKQAFRLIPSTIGTYHGKTASEHRADRAAALQRQYDSFERSDTDGCLSQHASGLEASAAASRAFLAECEGQWLFPCLMHDDGRGPRRVDAKLIQTQYGWCWMLAPAEEQRFDRKFIPDGQKSKVQKKFKLYESAEWADAYVHTGGEGKGLSGFALAHTMVLRAKEPTKASVCLAVTLAKAIKAAQAEWPSHAAELGEARSFTHLRDLILFHCV